MNPSQIQERLAQWRAALRKGEAETLLGALNWTDGNLCQETLACALAIGPEAKGLVDRLVKTDRVTGSYHGDWIKTAARTELAIDWAWALQTMESLLGRKALRRDLDCAWDDLTKQEFRAAGMTHKGSAAEALLGMVRHNPRVAARAVKKNDEMKLFYLVAMDPGGKWCRQARLDPESLLLAGRSANEFVNLLDSLDGQQSPLEQWLGAHPSHQRAWGTLVEKDRKAGELEADWKAEWLPDPAKFEDSKLAQWMVAVTRKTTVGMASPLNHPALDVAHVRGQVDEAVASQRYTRLLMSNAMEPINAIEQQIKLHNAFRLNKRIGWTSSSGSDWTSPEDVRMVPMDSLAIGLSHHKAWAWQRMLTDEGAKQFQALGNDPRIGGCLRMWSGQDVVEIILKQPLWQEWRNDQGESLLALWVREKEETGRMTPFSQRAAVSLARQLPELLTEVDTQGRKILERLSLNERTQAAVRKALLEQEVSPGAGAPITRKRAL